MSENVRQNVLIVNTAGEIRRLILQTLAGRGVRGVVAQDVAAATHYLRDGRWNLVVAIMGDGSDCIERLIADVRGETPDLPVVAVGNDGDVAQAVAACRAGATEYLTLPLTTERLETLIETLLPAHDVDTAASESSDTRSIYRIAGSSDALRETIRLAQRVASSTVPVLITGESGTGKELLAYLVHRSSRRVRNPYVRVNCAALSESLLESELFGHERGAFTGAVSQRKGRFELAHSGTLLLDEISETGPRLQAELLRVLEQQDFRRVGGSEAVNVDVRVVCTSNRDLAAEVDSGDFRADLFYRIRGVHLRMPALRRRIDDIPSLVWHFVNVYAAESRRRIRRLDEAMLSVFARYSWPGNVRQLRNVVRTLMLLGEGDTLDLDGAPQIVEELTDGQVERGSGGESVTTLSLQDLERHAVLEALRRTDSHQAKAAELLGISDRTLRSKLRRYREDGQLDRDDEADSKDTPSWLTSRAS
ncbi:MAG: AAA domain-containing protein [Planctomycetes bacterium]|nr:sigma-54-dependent Fis family transcriptional regulator [Phycisphaerae bacterium]NBB95053.1 AAA domain-containing protein [Planctomycetota bacterium]